MARRPTSKPDRNEELRPKLKGVHLPRKPRERTKWDDRFARALLEKPKTDRTERTSSYHFREFDRIVAGQTKRRNKQLIKVFEKTLQYFYDENHMAPEERDLVETAFIQNILDRRLKTLHPDYNLSSSTDRAAVLLDELITLTNEDSAVKSLIEKRLSAHFHQSGSTKPDKQISTFNFEGKTLPIVSSDQVLPIEERRSPGAVLWLDRDKSKKLTPPAFIHQVYRARLGRGFTQADLKKADESAYNALHQWLKKVDPETELKNSLPTELDLPPIEEWNARRLAQLAAAPWSINEDERVRLAKVTTSRSIRKKTKNNNEPRC